MKRFYFFHKFVKLYVKKIFKEIVGAISFFFQCFIGPSRFFIVIQVLRLLKIILTPIKS